MNKQSLGTGVMHETEVIYHVYYGASNKPKKLKLFHDEDAAEKFFIMKQNANLHVEAYKEVTESVRTITRLA